MLNFPPKPSQFAFKIQSTVSVASRSSAGDGHFQVLFRVSQSCYG